ncbi:MBL fold metallo-hydrolase [Bradyrhizobium sp.]|uniref:MBL fold metallo-hydrolase n=1 Tax=Bradyrhizobium sp. TaxID=376 RepID=UPI001ECC2014|nr:MBL fold metallo-hydrolase [Bradyrhizobium sp.]MBV9979512.1 MBL fold metallo-hydrolase [Bradyrhizobium sp.]
MPKTTRRDFVVSAAVASAAFGLDGWLSLPAPAAARHKHDARHKRQARHTQQAQHPKTPDPPLGYVRYTVGEAEVTALYDGIWEKAHDPAYFSNASIEETKQALAAGGFTTDFVTIPITVFVVKLKGKIILCDAGGGDQVQAFNPQSVFVSGKMIRHLKEAGIDPMGIETVLVSHFHPDHIFGLLGKNTDAPVFPMAEIIVPAAEYKFWTDPSVIGRLPEGRRALAQRIQAVVSMWKNVLPVGGEDEVVSGIRFLSAPGHTPGHTAFHLSSGNEQLMFSNDTVYVPALCAAHPGWHGVFDQDAALAEASRRKLIDRVIADRMLICGTHFPWSGLGTIAKDGAGYAVAVRTA